MPEVARATITVTPVLDGAQETLTQEMTNAAGGAGTAAGAAAGANMMTSLGDSMTKAGTSLTKNVTAPLTAIGVAATASWKSVDEGMDILVMRTGATGDALEEMQDILRDVTTTIPTDFATAGNAIGEVNTRFGVTGEQLEDLSTQFIKFAALNNTDVVNSIDTTQKALSAFGLGADDAGDLLDALTKASQTTGASVDTLASGLVQNATAFEELGLNAEQSVFMMAQLETSGANSETVMQGLRKALKNAATDGVSLDDALAGLQDAILNGTDGMDGLTAAYDLFGKSGDQIYGAVKNGTIDFTDLGSAAIDSAGAVNEAFEGTVDPLDEFTAAMNEIKLLGADIIDAAGPALKEVIDKIAEGVAVAAEKWNELDPGMQEFIISAAAVAAALGPILIIGGKVVSGISSIAGGIGGLVGHIGGLTSAASSAAGPVAAAGTSFGAMAGQALQLIAAAAALYVAAQAIQVLVNAAIEITSAGTPAIAVLGGMAIAIVGLMGAAAALGPALTAGAVGIGVFGAAMLGIGAGIDLACQGIATVIEAVADLTETIATNAEEIDSVITTIGESTATVISSISDGLATIIDALSGGISSVLDSIAGIIDSMGNAALNAGTGFEKLSNAVIKLVNETGVIDLAATLASVADGVSDINDAAAGAGDSADKIGDMTSEIKSLNTEAILASARMGAFGEIVTDLAEAGATAFSNLSTSIKTVMQDALTIAQQTVSDLVTLFNNTQFSFYRHIDVPHFEMSGSFNAETGTVPVIFTRWYAKAAEYGALFDSPTIIGVGDASQPELLLGENKLKELLGDRGTTVNNYFTVNGAQDPEAWASKAARRMKLEMRMA